MKDMVILGSILTLWFISVTLFGLIASDPTLGSLSSGDYSADTTGINGTFDITGDTDVNLLNVQNTGFWGVLKSLFTFSLPNVIGMPVIIGSFISFINYMVIVFAGLIGYRLLRSGGN